MTCPIKYKLDLRETQVINEFELYFQVIEQDEQYRAKPLEARNHITKDLYFSCNTGWNIRSSLYPSVTVTTKALYIGGGESSRDCFPVTYRGTYNTIRRVYNEIKLTLDEWIEFLGIKPPRQYRNRYQMLEI